MSTQEKITHPLIESLQWRYATKKFDAAKKISNEDLELLKTALQLSASSYGLQPYKFIFIENPEVRKQLQPHSWGQSQIVEASHLLILANQLEVGDADVDALIELTAKTRNIPVDNLASYGTFMKTNIRQVPVEAKAFWNAKQAYIALGFLLTSAAELKIDTCPIEGFEPEAYDHILNLKAQGLTSAVVAAIGYRSVEDMTLNLAKVRKSKEELFMTI
ncbi:MAG: NAD(P)H-dependent oxidoreductase [Flavobacteriales bacterium CG_4_9_14_3_um_filter_40_17]|nr:MAG: NAD(P)H-dependent oxidoreductase [Flavobacteriales bacterium CG_4_9_14_3_um_filter_40_17]